MARALPIASLCAHSAGCGRDIVLGEGRARADAATVTDAGRDGSLPSLSQPVAITAIATADATDDDPSLSADLTLLVFNSERDGGAGKEDIWFSVRATPSHRWQPPRPASELNTEDRETGIALSPDGLHILWSSDRPGGEGALDVYEAERTSRQHEWSAIRRVPQLSSAGDDLISAIAADGQTALLARRADGDDDYDLFIARRGRDAFETPEPIAELNSADEESDAFTIQGGRRLLFTRQKDLYFATRAAPNSAFGAPLRLDALNSDGDDRDPWATDDMSYVVFSSDRSGQYMLYEARR